MSCQVSASGSGFPEARSDLLQSLVVDKTGCVLWNVELPLLEMFPILPVGVLLVRLRIEPHHLTRDHGTKRVEVASTTVDLLRTWWVFVWQSRAFCCSAGNDRKGKDGTAGEKMRVQLRIRSEMLWRYTHHDLI